MSIVKQAVIKEIAKEIASGNTCYLHRKTAKITVINHSIEDPELIATQEQTLAEVIRKIENYVKIEKLSTKTQLMVMKGFIEDLSDKALRKQFSNALNRKNPIRNFNNSLGTDIELNLHWESFRFGEYQQWVSDVIIDAYNY